MKTPLLLCYLFLLFACAEFNSIHMKTAVNANVNAVSIDSKQRFLVATTLMQKNYS